MAMQVPMMIGILSVILFSVVDTIYVGRLGAPELAAMGFTFPVAFMFHSLGIGLGVGTSAVIARAIGGGGDSEVRRLTTDSLRLAFICIAVLAVVGLLTIDPLFKAMHADDATRLLIKEYMIIWYACVALLILPMVGNSAIRATGDTRTPMYIMLVAGAVNVALDPLLIFGIGPFPRMELSGAATATALSWGLTLVAASWFLDRRLGMLDFSRTALHSMVDSWRRILHISVPATATNMLIPVAGMVVTAFVARHGNEAVAAFAVGTRLESLVMVGCYAMSAAVTPFVGQNHGAEQLDRVRTGALFAARFAVLWGIGMCLLLGAGAVPLTRLFTSEPEVLAIARRFLWVVPVSYAGYGLIMQVSAVFNAMHRPSRAALVVCVRLFVLIVPLAWLGGRLGGPVGIFVGVSAGNLLGGGFAFLMLRRGLRNLAPHDDASPDAESLPTTRSASAS